MVARGRSWGGGGGGACGGSYVVLDLTMIHSENNASSTSYLWYLLFMETLMFMETSPIIIGVQKVEGEVCKNSQYIVLC